MNKEPKRAKPILPKHIAGASDDYMPTDGYKLDEGKLRFDLIPPEADAILAKILTAGAKKYADRNWERGMSWMRVYASLQRHLNKWLMGEDSDPDSGDNPMYHAFWCAMALSVYIQRGMTGLDDRFTPPDCSTDEWHLPPLFKVKA